MSEEISREEIAALLARGEEMTREELRDYVEEQRSRNNIPYHVYSALIDGIDTLEQEPCEDAISRQAVLNYIHRILNQGTGKKKSFEFIQKYVEKLPPVNPQPKTGKWIRVTDKTGRFLGWQCDKCGLQQRFNTNFCPDCGAKMEEVFE